MKIPARLYFAYYHAVFEWSRRQLDVLQISFLPALNWANDCLTRADEQGQLSTLALNSAHERFQTAAQLSVKYIQPGDYHFN